MAQFLYFLPGASGLDLGKSNLCAGYGLEEMAGGGKPGERRNARGPEAQEGILVRAAAEERPLEYAPDRQTWANAGKYWIGMWNDAKPGPEDLGRETMLRGLPMPLSDHNTWQIPQVKALPTYLNIDETGGRARKVLDEWGALSQQAERFFETVEIRGGQIQYRSPLSEDEQHDICMAALGANYRLGPYESALLQFPSSADYEWILWTLIDITSIVRDDTESAREERKKNSESDSTQ